MNVMHVDDLQFRYSKTAIPPDDPRATGKPDTTFLNRGEQYEVLPFINRFCSSHNVDGRALNLTEAKKVERMIHVHPGNIRSHVNVTKWIEENWPNYQ